MTNIGSQSKQYNNAKEVELCFQIRLQSKYKHKDTKFHPQNREKHP